MSNDPSPLKYMGTQSHETMAMEAAMRQRAARSTEQAGGIAAEGTAISDATNYVGQDPMRAMLIAAGTGAVLMGLVTMVARAGARTVRRNLQR